jgi:hypothetical protein
MTTRRDLESALASWAVDGGEAYKEVEAIFNNTTAALRKHFPGVSRDALDLVLADARRDAERAIYGLIHNTVDVGTAVNIIATRFLGED